MAQSHCFVGLKPRGAKSYLYKADKKTKFRQVIWGDFLTVDGEEAGGWLRIIWAPKDPQKKATVYIQREDTVEKRPLEIVFVDVGQGDGCVLISPETGKKERITIIDAGIGSNMIRFLNGRFRAYRGFKFDAAILTHPDEDHYGGFLEIFRDTDIGFNTVYHSGLVERPVSGQFEKIGGIDTDGYATELPQTKQDVEDLFPESVNTLSYRYPKVMRAAIDNAAIGDIRMLSTAHGDEDDGVTYMPGYSPSDKRGYAIRVLGPVVEPDSDGNPRLRKLGSYGETKNGHSVLLRLEYGNFSVLFGGDLNSKAETFLLQHYTGRAKLPKKGSADYAPMIDEARAIFQSDIMKSCHHGAADVTDAFLEAVNPAAFVISSGDAEGHVHPRPDLLGRLGALGRGSAPVILATELQRSTREREGQDVIDRVTSNVEKLAAQPSAALLAKVKQDLQSLSESNVEVYGAIYVKTDGEQLITAFKIEEQSPTDKWFYFHYVFDENGELMRTD